MRWRREADRMTRTERAALGFVLLIVGCAGALGAGWLLIYVTGKMP